MLFSLYAHLYWRRCRRIRSCLSIARRCACVQCATARTVHRIGYASVSSCAPIAEPKDIERTHGPMEQADIHTIILFMQNSDDESVSDNTPARAQSGIYFALNICAAQKYIKYPTTEPEKKFTPTAISRRNDELFTLMWPEGIGMRVLIEFIYVIWKCRWQMCVINALWYCGCTDWTLRLAIRERFLLKSDKCTTYAQTQRLKANKLKRGATDWPRCTPHVEVGIILSSHDWNVIHALNTQTHSNFSSIWKSSSIDSSKQLWVSIYTTKETYTREHRVRMCSSFTCRINEEVRIIFLRCRSDRMTCGNW